MANETLTTIIGHLARDPELRFTASGAAVANLTIASTPRKFDKNTNEWVDGETLWMKCNIWRQAAENVTESLVKGTKVIAQGRLKQRNWEKDGVQHQSIEMDLDEIGPALSFATAKVQKATRSGVQHGGGGYGSSAPADQGGDPWMSAPPAGGSSGYDSEPPF